MVTIYNKNKITNTVLKQPIKCAIKQTVFTIIFIAVIEPNLHAMNHMMNTLKQERENNGSYLT